MMELKTESKGNAGVQGAARLTPSRAAATAGCCRPAEQAACCEPSAKAACCGDAKGQECGCK